MILRQITPRLERYIGKEQPARLRERPYNEIALAMALHNGVDYRRNGEEVEISATGAPGGDLYVDAYARGGKRFSHWLFDLWPKLAAAKRAGLDLSRVIVTENPDPYVDETLAALGLTRANLVPAAKKGVSLKDVRVWSIGDVRAGMWTPPWVIEAVRGAFLGDTERARTDRKLYLSRNRAERRRTLNEDEVLNLLQPLGFETVHLEDLSLADAARLVSEADTVVAPHGAGLANIIFASPGCRVVEYFSWHISQEYWMLCNALRLPYVCIEGEGADGRRHFDLTKAERQARGVFSPQDIRVSIDDLKRALDL